LLPLCPGIFLPSTTRVTSETHQGAVAVGVMRGVVVGLWGCCCGCWCREGALSWRAGGSLSREREGVVEDLTENWMGVWSPVVAKTRVVVELTTAFFLPLTTLSRFLLNTMVRMRWRGRESDGEEREETFARAGEL